MSSSAGQANAVALAAGGAARPPAHPAKQRRRERISETATTLFLERGFDEVSIAEIARATGVSKMTVTNHFPLKEDLVFDEFAQEAELIRDAVRGVATPEEAVEAVERYCVDRERTGSVTRALNAGWRPDAWPRFAAMVLGSRALTQRYHAHYLELRDAVRAGLHDALPSVDLVAWQLAETVHFVDWWPIEAVGRGVPERVIVVQRPRVRAEAFAMLRRGLCSGQGVDHGETTDGRTPH